MVKKVLKSNLKNKGRIRKVLKRNKSEKSREIKQVRGCITRHYSITINMGYDIFGFLNLVEGIPKLQPGTDGKKFFNLTLEYEANRSFVESFIGMKIESIITKLAPRPIIYIDMYTRYKSIVKDIEKLYFEDNS